MTNKEIISSCGKIRGRDYGDHLEYRGIRYATAGRWEYPVLINSWDGMYDATEFKDCSYQRRSFEEDAVCNKFYHKEFRDKMNFTYSEDCQYLNIWSPSKPEACAVLIYIHGGSFTGGSSNESHISGTAFAKEGIIFISFNYRLGPFGFCSHPALTTHEGVCGNYGLFDQYMAIRWVRENIASFGGNPNKITLMGQSAGAMSVDIHSTSPLEKNWFSGIIMSSGAGLQRCALRPLTPRKTIRFWHMVLKEAGLTSIDELYKADPETVYYAWFRALKHFRLNQPYTLPVYDGKLLTKDTFCRTNRPNIPCIVGITKNDIMPLIVKHCLEKWVKSADKKNNHKCFTYRFNRALPGDNSGAWHSSDLLYFFSTLENNWRPFEKVDYDLSKQMSESLIAFTNTADPNYDSNFKWETGHKKPMIFL